MNIADGAATPKNRDDRPIPYFSTTHIPPEMNELISLIITSCQDSQKTAVAVPNAARSEPRSTPEWIHNEFQE